MDRLDEDLHVPCFIGFVLFLPEAVGVRGQGEGGVIVEAGVCPHHDPDHLGHGGGVHLAAAQLQQRGAALLHAGGEVVAHLQHEVGQRPVQQTPALHGHDAGREEARVGGRGVQQRQQESGTVVPGKLGSKVDQKTVHKVLINALIASGTDH